MGAVAEWSKALLEREKNKRKPKDPRFAPPPAWAILKKPVNCQRWNLRPGHLYGVELELGFVLCWPSYLLLLEISRNGPGSRSQDSLT